MRSSGAGLSDTSGSPSPPPPIITDASTAASVVDTFAAVPAPIEWPIVARRTMSTKPKIGRSRMDPVPLMNGGERAIGVAIPSATTLLSMSRGNPLKHIYPTDGTVATPAPTAIIANCPHPNAAKLFMEFATGPEYSRVITGLFNESLRPEVPPPVGGRPLNEIKLIMPTMEEAEKSVPEMREVWRDIFGV